MNKSSPENFKIDEKINLMTRLESSHNQVIADNKLIELVKSLARRAAQEDFTAIQDALFPYQSDK